MPKKKEITKNKKKQQGKILKKKTVSELALAGLLSGVGSEGIKERVSI